MEKRTPGLFYATLTGIIMTIFMLSSVTDRQLFALQIDLFGFSAYWGVNVMEILIPFTAVLSDLGMYLGLRYWVPDRTDQIILHLFLPLAVTITIGFTLRNISGDFTGWILLLITGVILYLVYRFEFIAFDPASSLRPVSVIVLDSLCYAVFLLFIIALRANVSRLIISIPAIFIVCFVISLKIYSFHVIHWDPVLVSVITGIMMCFADIGLHYWPVNIISYGALMFLWYYTFTNLVIGADLEEPVSRVLRRILPADIPAACLLAYAVLRL